MMVFCCDGSFIYSCSGKCVFKNVKDQFVLRDGFCDIFVKWENFDGIIVISY